MTDRLIWQAAEIVNTALEFGLIYLYLRKMLKRKDMSFACDVIWFVLSVAVQAVANHFTDSPMVSLGTTTIMLLALAIVFFRDSLSRKIFISLVFLVIIFVSECIFIWLLSAFNKWATDDLLTSDTGRLIGMIGTKILAFWMIVIISTYAADRVKDIKPSQWITIIMMPVVSICILQTIFRLIAFNSNRITDYGSVLLSIVGLMYINIAVFSHFEAYDRDIRLGVLEQVLVREEKNYKLLNDAFSEMRTMRHDIKNQLDVAQQLYEHGEVTAAKEHIGSMSEKIGRSSAVYTGNLFLDSLINIKAQTAQEHGIRFITKADISRDITADMVELCRIIGNALDNAIEECMRLGSDDTYVELVISQKDGKLVIQISNPTNAVMVDKLETHKQDKHSHGIGLISMRKSVELLGGIFSYKIDKSNFIITVIIKE